MKILKFLGIQPNYEWPVIRMHGLIWVVDSEDRDRFKESRDELMNLLQSDSIRGQIPILLFANKQDRNMLYICPIRDPMTARSGLNFKYF